jgi:protein disulfide-isomerase A1
MAKKYSDNKKLIFGEIDMTENDLENARVTSYPTIKLYPANEKDRPIVFTGKRDEASIIEFVKENAHYAVTEQQEQPEEAEQKPKPVINGEL